MKCKTSDVLCPELDSCLRGSFGVILQSGQNTGSQWQAKANNRGLERRKLRV